MPTTSSITRRSQRHRRRRSLSRKRLRGYSVRRTRRWAKRKGGVWRGRSLRGGAVGGIRGCLVEGEGGKHRRGGVDYREDSDGNWFVEIQPAESGMDPLPNYTLRLTSNLNIVDLQKLISDLEEVNVENGMVYLNLPSQQTTSDDNPNEIVTISVGTRQIHGICAATTNAGHNNAGHNCVPVFLKKNGTDEIVYVFQRQTRTDDLHHRRKLAKIKYTYNPIYDHLLLPAKKCPPKSP